MTILKNVLMRKNVIMKKTAKKFTDIFIPFLAAALTALLVVWEPFFELDSLVCDAVYSQMNGTGDEIVIVAIDEETLAEYGAFSEWSREKCAQLAAEGGYDYFCTTLTLSRHKDAVRINALGEEAALRYNVRWLPSDFKKRNGENRSQELAVMHGIYRQLYCGCEFSLRAREEGAVKSKSEETSAISASNNNT